MAKDKIENKHTPEEIKEAQVKVGAKALAVYTAKDAYVRTFTAELHGVDFVKLAEGFAEKIGGKVKKVG